MLYLLTGDVMFYVTAMQYLHVLVTIHRLIHLVTIVKDFSVIIHWVAEKKRKIDSCEPNVINNVNIKHTKDINNSVVNSMTIKA